jgi:hypothetical protein
MTIENLMGPTISFECAAVSNSNSSPDALSLENPLCPFLHANKIPMATLDLIEVNLGKIR